MKPMDMLFQNLGGEVQPVIETARDLEALLTLDETHWLSTGVPVACLNGDATFFKCLDRDGNGRIRTDEVRHAINWLYERLRGHERLAEGTCSLRLADINTDSDSGSSLYTAAQRVLANLGQKDMTEISLDQVRDRQRLVAGAACNGDGIIPPEEMDDPAAAALTRDIMKTIGSATDASGKAGISAEMLDTFLAEAKAYLDWRNAGRLRGGQSRNDVMVRGENTPAAWDALKKIQDKVDEYFAQCRLVKANPTAGETIKKQSAALEGIAFNDPEAVDSFIRQAPLAEPNSDEILSLFNNINPAWEEDLNHFAETAAGGKGRAATISREEWDALKAELSPYGTWLENKGGAMVEPLGAELLQKHLESPAAETIRKLIAADLDVAEDLRQVDNLECLILYHRYLLEFANNMVTFPRLFDPSRRSMIELGTLVMDGRRFDLAVRITDRALHRKVAEESNICVIYLLVRDREGESDEQMEVAVAVTSGSARRIYKGKRGVFFTIDGREWDAEITDLIINPVDLREAVLEPFRKIISFVAEQVEKITASRQKALEAGLGKSIDQAQNSLTTAPAGAKPSGGMLRDLMLGGSVAIAALGSSFAFVTKSMEDIRLVTVLKVLLGLAVIVLTPPLVMAVVKLRRRNLGIFLEACGFSMNAPMRLTRRLGQLFTRIPALPAKSRLRRGDLASVYLRALPEGGYSARTWFAGILLAVILGTLLGLAGARIFNIEDNLRCWFGGEKESISSPLPEPSPMKEKKKPTGNDIQKGKTTLPEPPIKTDAATPKTSDANPQAAPPEKND